MDPCPGTHQLQIFWRLLGPRCVCKLLIMLNGFGDSELRCFRTNVEARFQRPGTREVEGASNQQRISEITWVKMWEVTSQSCQIQLSWLWIIECQMETMTGHPSFNSMLRTPMWRTGRSWSSSSKKIVARMIHTVWLRYTNQTGCRKN